MTRLYIIHFIVFFIINAVSAQDFPGVKYGPETRQFMDIYIAPSSTPTPVYFDAHGNGGTTNMPNSIINALKDEGISIVAWESLTAVGTPEEVETGWSDAELMFAWVKENAKTYNFDTTRFIVGGSSRGSILSWRFSHRPSPNIKGLYMYNALPEGAWAYPEWWSPLEDVTVDSPPVFFVYKREPGSSEDATDPDIHDPLNGMMVMEKYHELGIGDRDTLIHSIGSTDNTDKYQFLVDFALSVLEDQFVLDVNNETDLSAVIEAFPNPFKDKIHISGLYGDEYFILSNLMGQTLGATYMLDTLEWSALPEGTYLLSIHRNSDRQVLRVTKR